MPNGPQDRAKTYADKAFDIAFRGDTEGIDEAMAQLFRDYAPASSGELREALERISSGRSSVTECALIARAALRSHIQETNHGGN